MCDTTRHDTTRFFAHHTIKWISSHICGMIKYCRHDKKLQTKNCSGSDFCPVSQRQNEENCCKNTVPIEISPCS